MSKRKTTPAAIGPCEVPDCTAPAVLEINWPAAKRERFCAKHGDDAFAGRLARTDAKLA